MTNVNTRPPLSPLKNLPRTQIQQQNATAATKRKASITAAFESHAPKKAAIDPKVDQKISPKTVVINANAQAMNNLRREVAAMLKRFKTNTEGDLHDNPSHLQREITDLIMQVMDETVDPKSFEEPVWRCIVRPALEMYPYGLDKEQDEMFNNLLTTFPNDIADRLYDALHTVFDVRSKISIENHKYQPNQGAFNAYVHDVMLTALEEIAEDLGETDPAADAAQAVFKVIDLT